MIYHPFMKVESLISCLPDLKYDGKPEAMLVWAPSLNLSDAKGKIHHLFQIIIE